MAKVTLEHPFAEIHGSITKSGLVNRQKSTAMTTVASFMKANKKPTPSPTHVTSKRLLKQVPNWPITTSGKRLAVVLLKLSKRGNLAVRLSNNSSVVKSAKYLIIILLKKHKLYLLTSEIASKHSSQTLVANTPIRKRRLTQKLVKANATLSSLPSSAQSSITPSKHRPLK